MQMLLKLIVGCLIALLAAHVCVAEERPPNIVFILADDLGWADTNPYGSWFHETPNISRLAERGMMLKNFHDTASRLPMNLINERFLHPGDSLAGFDKVQCRSMNQAGRTC
jgi:hypothetical protein